MKAINLAFVVLIFSSMAFAMPIKVNSPKVDLCPDCVDLIGNFIGELEEVVANSGIIGSCGALCAAVPNSAAQVVCDLLCDYVGIEAFIDAINVTDPDPIYVCQLIDVCAEVAGGNVTIVSATSSPATGKQGTTFAVTMTYKVVAPTGPGFLTIVVIPPDTGAPLSDSEFVEGQQPGEYQISWNLQTQPSENEPFSAGVYQAYVAVCEGDCTTKHPYGGIYAEGQTKFQIN